MRFGVKRMNSISVEDFMKLLGKIPEGVEWAGRRIAGNTFNKVSEEFIKMMKELGKVDPKDLLDREFVKKHEGNEYRIKFEKPQKS